MDAKIQLLIDLGFRNPEVKNGRFQVVIPDDLGDRPVYIDSKHNNSRDRLAKYLADNANSEDLLADGNLPMYVQDEGIFYLQLLRQEIGEAEEPLPDQGGDPPDQGGDPRGPPKIPVKKGKKFTPRRIEFRPKLRVPTDKELPDLLETKEQSKQDQLRFEQFTDDRCENENMDANNDLHAMNIAEIERRFDKVKNPITNGFENNDYDYKLSKPRSSRRRVSVKYAVNLDKVRYQREFKPNTQELLFADTLLSLLDPYFE